MKLFHNLQFNLTNVIIALIALIAIIDVIFSLFTSSFNAFSLYRYPLYSHLIILIGFGSWLIACDFKKYDYLIYIGIILTLLIFPTFLGSAFWSFNSPYTENSEVYQTLIDGIVSFAYFALFLSKVILSKLKK